MAKIPWPAYIASRSDIEDVIPALTAYQIEWNKMNLLLQRWPAELDLCDSRSRTRRSLRMLSRNIKHYRWTTWIACA